MRRAGSACGRDDDEASVKMADAGERKKTQRKLYPCDQRVKCGYDGCTFFGRLRSLDRHQNRRHPNLPKRIANSAFGEGGCWATWRVSQASLQSEYLTYLANNHLDFNKYL